MSEKMLKYSTNTFSKSVRTFEGTKLHGGPEMIDSDSVADSLYLINVKEPNPISNGYPMPGHNITASIWGVEMVSKKSECYLSRPGEKESLLISILKERINSLAIMKHHADNIPISRLEINLDGANAIFISQNINAKLLNEEFIRDEFIKSLSKMHGVNIQRRQLKHSCRANRKYKGGLAPRIWNKVEHYILENLKENLTLDRLAEIACLSPSHFSKAFKETAGTSPHQYILNKRLLIAIDLISKNKSLLREVAAFAGFSSQSHMTTTMKKVWGITPKQIRTEFKE